MIGTEQGFRWFRSGLIWSLLALIPVILPPVAMAVQNGAADVDFVRDVQPILERHCFECHGPDTQDGDLRFDDRTVALHEDFIVPGSSADSRVYEVMISTDDDRMPPPDDGDPVPADEVAVIKAWIDQGADWPAETVAAAQDDSQENSDTSAAAGKNGTESPPRQGTTGGETGAAKESEYWITVWRAFGELHPAVSHFPVALLVVGALFALISFRGSYSCADFAYYCLWLGALSAVVAAFLGWSFAWNEGHREDAFQFDTSARLFWHRWSGVALAIVSLVLAIFATVARRRDPEDGTLWKLCMVVVAALTIYVGHAGGELTHRRGYKKIFDLFSAKPAAQQPADQFPADE